MADPGNHIFQKIIIKTVTPDHTLAFFAQAKGFHSFIITLGDQEKIPEFSADTHFKKSLPEDNGKGTDHIRSRGMVKGKIDNSNNPLLISKGKSLRNLCLNMTDGSNG